MTKEDPSKELVPENSFEGYADFFTDIKVRI